MKVSPRQLWINEGDKHLPTTKDEPLLLWWHTGLLFYFLLNARDLKE
jgi:hypothetical protein